MDSCGQGFKVEAVLTIDSKGQIVIPKDLRERAGFVQNMKVALVSLENEGKICCLLMMKAEKLGDAVIETLRSIS